MVLTSIKPDREILTAIPTFWTAQPTLGAYGRLFSETNFLTYFWNSIFVAGCATLLTVFVATLAAYGITRFRFRGRETIAGTMLFTYMFAPIMIVVPFYILMRGAGLTNSHLGLILAYTTFSLPFSMWMLRSFFQSIPLELEEAAMMDGALAAQGRSPDHRAAGASRCDRGLDLHVHRRLERLSVCAGPDRHRQPKDAACRHPGPLRVDDHGLGNGDGGRRHDHHSGAALLPCGPALSHRRLGDGRRQGVGAFAHCCSAPGLVLALFLRRRVAGVQGAPVARVLDREEHEAGVRADDGLVGAPSGLDRLPATASVSLLKRAVSV